MQTKLERFGKYELLERIAAGGMAEVYLAKSSGAEGIGRFFAIKRILPQYSDNAEFIEMFKEEAKIAMNLNHSNVVQIFEFGIEKGQFFLVMEFVEGQNLRQIINQQVKASKPFTQDQVLFLCRETVAGLDHAHRCLDKATGKPLNIIHRDMSPQNIMISFEGEVKIVDFGIAKAETRLEQTRAGTIKGKFAYMSPEQADGQNVDGRTDVFSLGIILWELLTRERLFTGQSEAATLKKIRDCNIPSPRKLNPSVSPELERIVMQALAKDRGQRYQSAAHMHKDLNKLMNTQYPEFSTQDFSIFMKSLYADTFMQNRKKLAMYANLAAPASEDRTSISITESQGALGFGSEGLFNNADSSAQGESDKKNRPTELDMENILPESSQKIDLASLRGNGSPGGQQTHHSQSRRPAQKTQTKSRSRKTSLKTGEKGAEASGWMGTAIVFVSLAFIGWFIFASGHVNVPKNLKRLFAGSTSKPALIAHPGNEADDDANSTSSVEQSSVQFVPLNIQSFPQGAEIRIDGKTVGTTPYSGKIEANKKFQLVLKRDGYISYEREEENSHSPSTNIKATLVPEPPAGFVSIEVKNATPNIVIKVNNISLKERPPIRRFRIPAGIPIRVQIIDPFANVTSEQVVTVGQGQENLLRFNLANSSQTRSSGQ